jgi:hypothetical protein
MDHGILGFICYRSHHYLCRHPHLHKNQGIMGHICYGGHCLCRHPHLHRDHKILRFICYRGHYLLDIPICIQILGIGAYMLCGPPTPLWKPYSHRGHGILGLICHGGYYVCKHPRSLKDHEILGLYVMGAIASMDSPICIWIMGN